MFSEEKIKQVFSAIKDNGLNAFDDESLAKLLSILNKYEFDEFEQRCYEELEGMDALKRIMDIRPLVEVIVNRELFRIRNSSIYSLYIESLSNGQYREFFQQLEVEELADLKKYVNYTTKREDEINVSGSNKIIKMITKEIKRKEALRKPNLENKVMNEVFNFDKTSTSAA